VLLRWLIVSSNYSLVSVCDADVDNDAIFKVSNQQLRSIVMLCGGGGG
jgi:hypothetical protein